MKKQWEVVVRLTGQSDVLMYVDGENREAVLDKIFRPGWVLYKESSWTAIAYPSHAVQRVEISEL